MLLYTSGTTSAPKAVVLSHANLLSYVLETVEFGSADEHDAILASMPPYHVAGMNGALTTLYSGRRLVHLPNFDPGRWLELTRNEDITHAMLVPTMLSRIVDVLDGRQAGLPSLRHLAYGGAKMPRPVLERALEAFPGVGFVNAETSSTIAVLGPDDHRDAHGATDPRVRERLGSVGRVVPGVEAEVRDSDRWLLSGQKIWTSLGAFADHCIVLARTDADVPKHKGISAFLLDLSALGVTVRPIVLANGDEEFAEIFLDNVAVPARDMLGEPGQGRQIALSVISYERGAVDVGYRAKFERYFAELAAGVDADRLDDASLERVGTVAVELEVFRMHCLRSLSRRAGGNPPGNASSVDKILMTLVEQDLLDTALAVADLADPDVYDRWFGRYLYARAGSIYGGSAQIQKGILAERVLGLRFREGGRTA